MEAYQLLEGSGFDPRALKAICHAFDEAWFEIAPRFKGRPAMIATARAALARAVLSVAWEDSIDNFVLKTAALQVMNHDFRLKRDGTRVSC